MKRFEDVAQEIIDDLPPLELPKPSEENRAFREHQPRFSDDSDRLQELEPDELTDGWSRNRTLQLQFPPLSEKETEEIHGAVTHHGLDALAFYKSIRHRRDPPFQGRWGIFLLDKAIGYLADGVVRWYPNKFSRAQAEYIGARLLHRHEAFHFRVDAWTLGFEKALKRGLYVPYQHWVYERQHPNGFCYEESLANCFAFQSLRTLGVSPWVREFMSGQPGMYAEFDLSASSLEDRKGELALQLLEAENWWLGGTLAGLKAGASYAPFIGMGKYIADDRTQCPCYVIAVANLRTVLPPFRGLPTVAEFVAFVTKYLSGQLIRRSDHTKYKIDNGSVIRIPNPHRGNDRLQPWELLGSLRLAGMTKPDYDKAREETNEWTRSVPRSESKARLI